jgi:hypothetical protein
MYAKRGFFSAVGFFPGAVLLTAAAHGKLKRKIVLHEDEVTSCIFGEMQHLPTDVIWKIFSQLTKDAKIKDVKTIENVFCESPDKVNFEFWPQWQTGVRHVEPDLVVHFSKENSPLLHVIVEVKWGARLFPPCELIRQWNWSHSRRNDEAPWMHLYLVKDTAMGRTEIESSLFASKELCKGCARCKDKDRKRLYKGSKFDTLEEWHGRLGCIGWRHVVKDISDIDRAWGSGVSAFFAKQGIVAFTGFELLNKESICELTTDQKLFFHSEPWFGFLDNKQISQNGLETMWFLSKNNH